MCLRSTGGEKSTGIGDAKRPSYFQAQIYTSKCKSFMVWQIEMMKMSLQVQQEAGTEDRERAIGKYKMRMVRFSWRLLFALCFCQV